MRRLLIRGLLPLVFVLVPVAGAVVVAFALPPDARSYYVGHITGMDVLILCLGTVLFVSQSLLCWQALRWMGPGFDERADPWLSHLSQAAEWFPLLGLLGTVAAILQTFGGINGPTPPERIIALYAPAITATGSGLFMALVNILPTWVVMVGRDLILAVSGVPNPGSQPTHPLR